MQLMANPLQQDLDHVLKHTEGLWDELRGQRLFITGGTGFFGCWLLESLTWAIDRLGLHTQAVVLTRNPEAFKKKAPHLATHPAIRLHMGDICDFQFPTGSFAHVIHAATEVRAKLNTEQPLRMFDTIVTGTRRALDFSVHAGAKKFLLTSSGAVYGRQPPDMTHIPEEYLGAPDPMDPQSAYGEEKRAAEMLCGLYASVHNLEPKIARCFALVGPYLPLDAHFAIGNFIRDALRGGPIQVHGDGTPYRSYLYAADLAIWLWTILFRAPSCRAFNLGSDHDLSILALANRVAELQPQPTPVRVLRSHTQSRLINRYVPAITRARIELGLDVLIPLDEAINRSIAWSSRSHKP